MPQSNWIVVALAAAVLVVGGWYFLSGSPDPAAPDAAPAATAPAAGAPAAPAPGTAAPGN
ncbi:MAG TPA: hypothetical protein PKD10_19155 [Paracoccaceae bacterium]|nr:hypothetical protein [Paracoccaceae bacterium]HMO73393.1 hypothetical protein [Paracoccaceae bacterium]